MLGCWTMITKTKHTPALEEPTTCGAKVGNSIQCSGESKGRDASGAMLSAKVSTY